MGATIGRSGLGRRLGLTGLLCSAVFGFWSSLAAAQNLPEIRTSERNRVPQCVTPERLMRFLGDGNKGLKPQFRDIAKYYKEHGDRLRIRWDYAFYQMILETNYLKFVNGSGQGDVNPRQNNFAGIGTTGGGVPGDSFPDVSTGVLGQMQHLIAYSGEHVDNPVARRTREKQDEIIQKSKALGRSPTFKDLTRRWAADGRYASSMEFVAGRFRSSYCNGSQKDPGPDAEEAPAPNQVVASTETEPGRRGRGRDSKRRSKAAAGKTQVAAKPVVTDEELAEETTERTPGAELATRAVTDGKTVGDDRRAGLGAPGEAPLIASPSTAQRPKSCAVLTASYGGQKNVLIRAQKGQEMQYTALQVIDGQEESLAVTFIRSHAAGGELVGSYPTREAALRKAFDLCPTAANANR